MEVVPLDIGGELPSRESRRRLLVWYRLLLSTIAAVSLLWVAVMNGERAMRPVRIGASSQISTAQSVMPQPAISPDGKWVAYAANLAVHREVPRQHARVCSTNRRHSRRSYHQRLRRRSAIAVWSPDGLRVAFKTPHTIQVAPAFGGIPDTLVADPEDGASR
jgi:hypothetical protein